MDRGAGGEADARPRPRVRAPTLPLHKLLEALLLSRLLRSMEDLPQVLFRSVASVYGPEEAAELRARVEGKDFPVPAPTQISHARLKLDVLLMQLRREEWQSLGRVWITLSSDSSPQGLDFMVTVEDRIQRPGQVVDATAQELAMFSLSDDLQTSILPPCVIGSGNSDTAAKFEALLRSVMLDVGHEGLTEYGSRLESHWFLLRLWCGEPRHSRFLPASRLITPSNKREREQGVTVTVWVYSGESGSVTRV